MYGRIHFLLRVSLPSVRIRYGWLLLWPPNEARIYSWYSWESLEYIGHLSSWSPFRSVRSSTFSSIKTFRKIGRWLDTFDIALTIGNQEDAGRSSPNHPRWLLSAEYTITLAPMSSWKEDTIGQAKTPAWSSCSVSSSSLRWACVHSSSTGECFAERPRSRRSRDRCIAAIAFARVGWGFDIALVPTMWTHHE